MKFLTSEPIQTTQVRDTILASWRRSRGEHVPADRIEIPFLRDPDLDTALTRSAEPVLRDLCDQLIGQPISVVLTDHTGLVLRQLTPDQTLSRYLERVQLVPGFSYAEQFVGTNGIGTALESGTPVHVFGHEHYAENLEGLACAGVPITHPISGKTVGLLDLTCWIRDAGPLLGALAKGAADQIRQSLLLAASAAETELLHEYLRVCRRRPGIVFAVSADTVMMNNVAQRLLAPADQAALLRQAGEALCARHGSVVTELPSGTTVRLYSRAVGDRDLASGVVHVRVLDTGGGIAPDVGTPTRMLLPGLVGAGPLWRHACDEVEHARTSGEWLALEGEVGVGKVAILRAVHQRHNPAGRFTVIDATNAADRNWLVTVRQALDDSGRGGTVVIRHIDTLDGRRLREVTNVLRSLRADDSAIPPWVVVTATSDVRTRDFVCLLQLFPTTLEVPPLRHHIEDLTQLVPFFLNRLGDSGQLTCPPDVVALLMRSTWPGNVSQVLQVLRGVVRRRRTGMITSADLPPDTLAVSRRLLSPLESMERDAIVRVLRDTGNNKARAARSLGMSRATIYRKIHEFGIMASGA